MTLLPPLRDVIQAHGLGAKKSLGQHFLLDLNLTGRIARTAGDMSTGTVIEIGPGPGGLTRAILEAGAQNLIAIETDRRCVEVLAEISAAYPDRVTLVEGDALKVDISTLGEAPRRIVANLPYNVSTALLVSWLPHAKDIERRVWMFQKEVADRLCAEPRTKAYGRLSVMSQWLFDVRFEFNVDKRAFTPPPKVTSTIVSLVTRPEPLAPANFKALETVVGAAFGQRRKMLRASLKRLGVNTESLIEQAEITPTARAEELSVEQFCALARVYESLRAE